LTEPPVGVLGPAADDRVVLEEGVEQRRPGGTPHYAARALRAAGATPVVIEEGTLLSQLEHTAAGTRQQILSLPEPLDAARAAVLLPQLRGCRWLLLGGQTGGDFPPETLAVLAAAGHLLCMDGQGLARGSRVGPVRLGPITPAALEGVTALKLNLAEALQAGPLAVPELLVTRAERGCLVTVDGVEHVVEGNGRRFADPTGAGDSFAALYCLGRTRGLDPPAAAGFAQHEVERLYQAG
jgi:sugar/nucleoside kinase (ribokinase family)